MIYSINTIPWAWTSSQLLRVFFAHPQNRQYTRNERGSPLYRMNSPALPREGKACKAHLLPPHKPAIPVYIPPQVILHTHCMCLRVYSVTYIYVWKERQKKRPTLYFPCWYCPSLSSKTCLCNTIYSIKKSSICQDFKQMFFQRVSSQALSCLLGVQCPQQPHTVLHRLACPSG